MSRHHQKPAGKTAVEGEDRRLSVERLIEKGKEKEAFKQAKLYFHQQASPENRRLVELTYVKRIQSMIRGGMTSTGREIALSMLEFGVTDPDLLQEVALLLPQVGLIEQALTLQGQVQSSEAKAHLSGTLVDQAVLHPEQVQAAAPELHAEASPVRQALAAYDAGNDAQALELLQAIPRSSPLADWRMFVRGLVAFRSRDLEQAKANWERLDPQRSTRKIARSLLALSERPTPGSNYSYLKPLERIAFGESVLEPLSKLRRTLEEANWDEALAQVAPLRRTLHRIDPRLSQRLTEIVMGALSVDLVRRPYADAERWIDKFHAALEPLPWDPNWNRFLAILWDRPDASASGAIEHWKLYLDELERGVAAPLGEPNQVKALVSRRLGRLYSKLAEPEPTGPFSKKLSAADKAKQMEHRTQAVEALQQSIRLDPTQHQPYEILLENYTDWEQPDKVIATLEQLLQAHPDHVDAWRHLISLRQERDEPELMLSAIARLRALRPLDSRLDYDEAFARLTLARQLALKQRWEEGRAEFARMEQSSTLRETAPIYRLYGRRAAFEFKAGDAALAEEYVARANAAPHQPSALSLALAIEADRYELPETLRIRFNQEFAAATVGKATSAAAGALAGTMVGYTAGSVQYPSLARHLQVVVGYIKRTTRLKYQESDLRSVCSFLKSLDGDDKVLVSMTRKGLKQFPRSPFFHMMDAELDFRKGPFKADPRAIQKKLEKAIALAEASQDPNDARLIPQIKEMLERISALGDVFSSFPFGQAGMPRSPDEFRRALEDILGGFDDDDDEAFGPEFDEPPSGRGPTPPKRKPK